MRPLLAITHLQEPRVGVLGEAAAAAGIELELLNLRADTGRRPGLDAVSGIASFGGVMGVNEAPSYPFLQWELELIRDVVDQGVPFFGFCLGAQLLAKLQGVEIRHLESEVIRWSEVLPTAR